MKKIIWRRRYWLFWFWVVVTCVGLFMPSFGPAGRSVYQFDKVAHFVIFFVLSAFSFLVSVGNRWLATICLVGFAIVSEVIQECFIVGRTYEVGDLFFNYLGVMFGYFFIKKNFEGVDKFPKKIL